MMIYDGVLFSPSLVDLATLNNYITRATKDSNCKKQGLLKVNFWKIKEQLRHASSIFKISKYGSNRSGLKVSTTQPIVSIPRFNKLDQFGTFTEGLCSGWIGLDRRRAAHMLMLIQAKGSGNWLLRTTKTARSGRESEVLNHGIGFSARQLLLKVPRWHWRDQ